VDDPARDERDEHDHREDERDGHDQPPGDEQRPADVMFGRYLVARMSAGQDLWGPAISSSTLAIRA